MANPTLRRVALVSCGKQKLSTSACAEMLYTSPLFQRTRELVLREYDAWFVLSALYGVLSPDATVYPYEKTLKGMSGSERQAWGKTVVDDVRRLVPPGSSVDLFAGANYSRAISAGLRESGYLVSEPMAGLSIGRRLAWLKGRLSSRCNQLDRMYELIEKLKQGGAHAPFSEVTGRMLPRRGVYFFFEPGETRRTINSPRIVRIGTHGVSRGSRSTLWHRLKTHLGLSDGRGNHRASIFRLHVGAAIAQQQSEKRIESWGAGMSGSKEQIKAEEALEREVTAFMRKLHVAWLAVEDEPNAQSDRACLEQNLIGLLSNHYQPVDVPSPSWLGRHSPTAEIRQSALWNVRATNNKLVMGALDMLDFYVDVTLGRKKAPSASVSERFLRADQAKLDFGPNGNESPSDLESEEPQ